MYVTSKWTIQRTCQHRVHKMEKNKTKKKLILEMLAWDRHNNVADINP
jgi:hypothetical protein